MKRIILDTNALMAIVEFKMDIFAELAHCCDFPYQVMVLEGTVQELEVLVRSGRGKYHSAAKVALALLQTKRIGILNEGGVVDDLLVKHSKRGDLVLTQDIALKRRLQKPHLTIRQKKKVITVI